MKITIGKVIAAGLTFGGLEYAKYRLKGGVPLLRKAKEAWSSLMEFCEEDENTNEPIKLEANDFKIV